MRLAGGRSEKGPCRRAGLAGATVLTAAVLGIGGCTAGGDEEPSEAGRVGVLETADLEGDGWSSSDEGGGSLCGGLTRSLRSISEAGDGSEATLARDGVTVVSQAWVAREGSGSRRSDFERLRGAAGLCGPVDEVDEDGISAFEISADEADRFVVNERRTIRGVDGGADMLFFSEGPVVGVVVAAYEGDEAPLSVTDLEDEARTRAGDLAARDT
ncbi:MAG: hypothetical protein ACRDWI_11685 [Jiangellaceae bacterium]